jgi:hypothetical protein
MAELLATAGCNKVKLTLTGDATNEFITKNWRLVVQELCTLGEL